MKKFVTTSTYSSTNSLNQPSVEDSLWIVC